MNDFLHTDIKFAKGLGEHRADILRKELGMERFEDLLNYFPFRYVDRSLFQRISDIDSLSRTYQIKGVVTQLNEVGVGRKKQLRGQFYDGERTVELVWFKGVAWIKKNVPINQTLILFGKPSKFKGKLNFAHPELSEVDQRSAGLEAVYSVSESMRNRKLDSKAIQKVMVQLTRHEHWDVPEIFTEDLRREYQLISRSDAFKILHNPPDQKWLDHAVRRMKFEELFFLQFPFVKQKVQRSVLVNGIRFSSDMPLLSRFLAQHLPFELTGAQERVLSEIKTDLCSGKQMNRLLQGDVGSGKTIVAFLSMLMAIDNGGQACLMAPTEILATQHFIGLQHWARSIGLHIALLTGSTSATERKEIHRLLRSGHLHILVGTHALIEDTVLFHRLAFVVIDEQHRFGVAQRARLQEKGHAPPHVLVMTATPIPRTLAMSLYGDLDYSVIDELPGGRRPIITAHRFSHARQKVWAFIKEELGKGRQAYVVYPLIEESETLHYKDLNNGYDELLKYFPRPEYQVDMLHGQMKAEDKEATMQRFKQGISHILVSTTVIEVGIDVPNASIMLIESSEKFGLSQLHQLRGRVGRGGEQSYCILMSSKKLSENAETRIKAMVSTTSGFDLSEIDMRLRGFGDIAGTRQSGLDQLKLASLSKDQSTAKAARDALQKLFSEDPELRLEKHAALRLFIASRSDYKEWSKIA